MKNITFAADEELIAAAREQAEAEGSTLKTSSSACGWYVMPPSVAPHARWRSWSGRVSVSTWEVARSRATRRMSVGDFLDTNALVYMFDRQAPAKQATAKHLVRDALTTESGWFYDIAIVAAALEAGCRRLLTEDLQHGRKVGSLRVENPFLP